MKRVLSYVFLAIIFISVTACSSEEEWVNMEYPPEIIITANSQPVEYDVGLNMWNGSAYDRLDQMPFIMEEDSDVEVAHVELGGTIDIEFVERPPKTVEMVERLIDEKGCSKYADENPKTTRLEIKDGKLSYDFTAIYDTEDENTYRGYYLNCIWSNRSFDCEYAFVIKTIPNEAEERHELK